MYGEYRFECTGTYYTTFQTSVSTVTMNDLCSESEINCSNQREVTVPTSIDQYWSIIVLTDPNTCFQEIKKNKKNASKR